MALEANIKSFKMLNIILSLFLLVSCVPENQKTEKEPESEISNIIDSTYINVGSIRDYKDSHQIVWEADKNVVGGSVINRGSSILVNGGIHSELYQTERWGEFEYKIPVDSGTYKVVLHFAETGPSISDINQRIFTVNTEGKSIQNLDIFNEAGGSNQALLKSINGITVNDGILNIDFISQVQNPMLNAIEIHKTGEAIDTVPEPTETVNDSVDLPETVDLPEEVADVPETIDNPVSTDDSAEVVIPEVEVPVEEVSDTETPDDSETVEIIETNYLSSTYIEAGSLIPYIDSDGIVWEADINSLGGSIVDRGLLLSIIGTDSDRLYQTERWGNIEYELPAENGTYIVKLHFAETHSITSSGQRVFSVNIGDKSLSNIDIYREAGGSNRALVKVVSDVTVSNGLLNIDFISQVQNPMVNAIEIHQVSQSSIVPETETVVEETSTDSPSVNEWISNEFDGVNQLTGIHTARYNVNSDLFVTSANMSAAKYSVSFSGTKIGIVNTTVKDLFSRDPYGAAFQFTNANADIYMSNVYIEPNWPSWVSYGVTNYDGIDVDQGRAFYAEDLTIKSWNADGAIDNKAQTSQLVRVNIEGSGNRALRYWNEGPHFIVNSQIDNSSGAILWSYRCDTIKVYVYNSTFNGQSKIPSDKIECDGGSNPQIVYLTGDPITAGVMHPMFGEATSPSSLADISPEVITPTETVEEIVSSSSSYLSSVYISSGSEVAYTDIGGNLWQADKNVLGGSAVNRGSSISVSGTVHDTLYQTERWGNFEYKVPVDNGVYTIVLHFAETGPAISGIGQRIFDVNAEGNLINRIDIFKESGGTNQALLKTLSDITVQDGVLNIDFIAGVQNPMLNGIEIHKTAESSVVESPAPSVDPVDSGTLVTDTIPPSSTSYTTELYLNSAQKLTDKFNSQYNDSRLPTLSDENSLGNKFSFDTTNWISFYISMHKLTQDKIWLDRADKTIQFMFDHTDEKKYERGELAYLTYKAGPDSVFMESPFVPLKGWSRDYGSGGSDNRAEILENGNICRHIMMVVDYIKVNRISGYDVDEYPVICGNIIKDFDSNYVINRYSSPTIDGAYYYPNTGSKGNLWSNPVPFNHNAVAAEAAILIYKYTKDTKLLEKALLIRDYLLRNFRKVGNYYEWNYLQFASGEYREVEDVNHGSYDVHFLYVLWREGYVSEDVIRRIVNTIPVFLTETSCAHNIAGEGTDDGGDWSSVTHGYLDAALALADDNVLRIMLKSISHSERNGADGLWHARYRSIADVLAADMQRLNGQRILP